MKTDNVVVDKRPHFDIAQKQILVWKNEEKLIQRLLEWIKSLH